MKYFLAILLMLVACTTTSQQSTGEVKEFRITARQFEFSPSTIQVNKGDRVRIIAETADVNHGLAIPDFKVDLLLEPGKPQTVEFVADKTGTFTFFCNVPCGEGHREMTGTLIVN